MNYCPEASGNNFSFTRFDLVIICLKTIIPSASNGFMHTNDAQPSFQAEAFIEVAKQCVFLLDMSSIRYESPEDN